MADLLGDRAIRFARPKGIAPRALVRAVRAWPGVIDVVVAREDVAAYFVERAPAIDDDDQNTRIAALAKITDDDEEEDATREITIQATYDGEDLDAIARDTGLEREAVIRIHSEAIYVVETMGFAPGFAYLSGLDARLRLPRRTTPRVRVPAGSIAIADDQTAVYPFDSPGGWHLVGRTNETMFGLEGCLLRLGDRVRFACRC